MNLIVSDTPEILGQRAAAHMAKLLREAINQNGSARLLLSTGASQFEVLKNLRESDVDWTRVTLFHLDEYIGLDENHKASFVRYLKTRFTNGLTFMATHFLSRAQDPDFMKEITQALREAPVDAALIGIGENAHIAFNDPPADFDSREAYITVKLDEACKRQQVREGWFADLSSVPPAAITMTPWQIMQSRVILSVVPHAVKAEAVKRTLKNEVTQSVPATLLKTHPDWTLYLDTASAGLL